MKRKKSLLREEISEIVFSSDRLMINKSGNINFFEIGEQITTDIAEAVSMMIIKGVDMNDPIWKVEIKDYDFNNIIPERSLFWLTGGYKEWDNMINYNRPWSDCYLDFQEEFGFLVINGVKRYKRLKDIRDYFLRYLNLPVLYDFAVSKNFIR
jgi:hypothetical protein